MQRFRKVSLERGEVIDEAKRDEADKQKEDEGYPITQNGITPIHKINPIVSKPDVLCLMIHENVHHEDGKGLTAAKRAISPFVNA